MASFSAHPPSLLVSVDHSSRCHDALARVRAVRLHLLHAGQEPVARVFAGKGDDKFGGLDWELGRRRAAASRGVLAYVRCRRAENFERYDHTILIGDMAGGEYAGGEPLLYSRRRMDWLLRPAEPHARQKMS